MAPLLHSFSFPLHFENQIVLYHMQQFVLYHMQQFVLYHMQQFLATDTYIYIKNIISLKYVNITKPHHGLSIGRRLIRRLAGRSTHGKQAPRHYALLHWHWRTRQQNTVLQGAEGA